MPAINQCNYYWFMEWFSTSQSYLCWLFFAVIYRGYPAKRALSAMHLPCVSMAGRALLAEYPRYKWDMKFGIILWKCPANERRHIVAWSPIGWTYTQDDPWNLAITMWAHVHQQAQYWLQVSKIFSVCFTFNDLKYPVVYQMIFFKMANEVLLNLMAFSVLMRGHQKTCP